MINFATSLHYIGLHVNHKISLILLENLELNLELSVQNNSFLVAVLGDFNATSSNWCKNDIITTESKGIANISAQFSLHEVINDPADTLEFSSPCIDLLFSSQSNLINGTGVHPSLYPNSNHQIIFEKCTQKIIYLSPYFRDAWHYNDTNTDLILQAIAMFDWDRAFFNTNVNEKLFILNQIILDIVSSFIPHETLTVDDKNPPWFNK